MAKQKKRKKPEAVNIVGPTDEQMARGEFRRANLAYKRIAVIETLYEEHKLTARQFNGLARYRDVAIADDRSLIEDSVGKMLRGAVGGGQGLCPASVRTAIELGRLERALGSLAAIARAIAVEDKTISQWAMEHGGSVERRRGNVVKFEPTKTAFKVAWADVRMAGERLAAEIGA